MDEILYQFTVKDEDALLLVPASSIDYIKIIGGAGTYMHLTDNSVHEVAESLDAIIEMWKG